MKQIMFLSIAMFALGMDAYVIAGIVPEISAYFDIGEAQTGQMVTAFTLSYALSAPLFATMLSNIPIKKSLAFALVLFIIANLATLLSSNLTILLVSRVLAGIGAGIFSPLAAATAVTLVPKEKKGRALGLILGGMSAGTVVGVPLGLTLSSMLGWQSVFMLVILIALLGLIGIFVGLNDVTAAAPPSLKERVALLANKQVLATVGVTFLTAIASLGLYTYMAPILLDITSNVNIIPYLWVWGVGGMIGSFTIGYLIDWTKRPRMLLLAILIVMSISLWCIPISQSLASPLLFIPFLLWGAAGWSSLAPQQHTLLGLQPKHGAAVVALNSSCNYLGGAVGAILGGIWLSSGQSPASMPFLAGGIGLCAVIAQIIILWANKKKSMQREDAIV